MWLSNAALSQRTHPVDALFEPSLTVLASSLATHATG